MQNSPEPELQNVRNELNATKKKLERYSELIAKLYDELDVLRNNSCEDCKKQALAASSGGGRPSRPSRPVPLSRRVLGPPNPRPFITPPGCSDRSHIQPTDKPPTHKPLPMLPTEAAPIILRPSGTVSAPTPTIRPATTKPLEDSLESEPYWIVDYNPDIQRTLDVRVAEILNCDSAASCVKFSRNGKYLAVGLSCGETHVYDLKTLSKSVLAECNWPTKKENPIWSLGFSPDDLYLATGFQDGQIKIWNLARKRVRTSFKGHNYDTASLEFSPNGQFLVSASWDCTVRLWRMRDGSSRQLMAMDGIFNTVSFSLQGRYVFSGNDDSCLRIWDTRTNKLMAKWKGHLGRVWCVALSKDGKGLVSGGEDKIMKYWDTSQIEEYKEEILRFEGHTGYIRSITFSSDGRWIFSTSPAERSTRIWDAKTATLQCTLKGHNAEIWGADVSPTGQLLASGSRDGCVRIWKVNATE